jgi:hypothetical protein
MATLDQTLREQEHQRLAIFFVLSALLWRLLTCHSAIATSVRPVSHMAPLAFHRLSHAADESLRSLDWSHNKHLRSIGFEIGYHFRDCTAFVTQMLSLVDSVHIERVIFTLPSLHSVDDLLIAGPLHWEEVEAELAKPWFSRLKRVDISFLSVEEPFMLQRASVYLPQCHERGILHISEGRPVF